MGVSTLLTEEEFLNLPEYAGKQELLDGELIELPPAKYPHHELAKRISVLLESAGCQGNVWLEMPYRLSAGKWLIPDVSVSWPGQQKVDEWLQSSPMLAIEVASRGNTPEELEKKRLLYLAHGASEVWVVYPKTHTMLVSRTDSSLHIDAETDYRCELIGVTVTPAYRTPAA